MTTTPISLATNASFGNPLWRNGATNPLTNAALPAAIASATPIYKVSLTQSAELLLPLQALVLTGYITSLQVTVSQGTQTTAPNLPTLVSLGILVNGTYQFTQSQPLVLGVANTLSFPTKADGTAWLASDIVNTVVKIIDQSTSGEGNLYSLSINAISTSVPTVTIAALTTITSSTPQISWTYADTDLALQSGFQVQVVDTVTGASVVDSGFIFGLDTSYQVPANLVVDNHLSSSIGTFAHLAGSTSQAWSAIASSSDGTIIYASVNGGSIYVSTNSGTTFVAIAGTSGQAWVGLACTSDGAKLFGIVASGAGQGIYVPLQYVDGGNSTSSGAIIYDAGSSSTVSWTATIDSGDSTASGTSLSLVFGSGGITYTAIACSSDGSKIFVASNAGGIFVSLDGGLTFTLTAGTAALNWTSITCSSDGTDVYATVSAGSIYRSANSGSSFAAVASTTPFAWTGISCSSDGSLVYASVNGGKIYKSSDSGISFAVLAASSTLAWIAIDCSANGEEIYAAVSAGTIYASLNYGASFATTGVASQSWTAIVCSSVGSSIYATVNVGYVWGAVGVTQYTYRVRVTKSVNGINNFTAYSSFIPSSTVYNDTPPSFAITISADDPVITVTLPDVSALGYVKRDIVVLRQWSGGFGIIRNGTIANVGLGAGTVVLTDFEHPNNETLTYKVKAIYYDASGNEYVGTAVSDSIVLPALSSWWIQRCDGADDGIPVKALLSAGMAMSRNRPKASMYPLGSRYPVTVSGTVQGYDGDITFYFDNNPAFISFAPYLDYVGKLIISSPAGAYKYISLDKTDVQKTLSRGTDLMRELKIAYTEEDSGLGFNEPSLFEF